MLKKFEKFENKLNEILGKLIALWFRLLRWIVPQKVYDLIQQTKQKLIDQKLAFKVWCIQSAIKLKDKSIELFIKIKQFKLVTITGKIKTKANNTKDFLLKTPLKTQIQFLTKHFKPKLNLLSEKFKKCPSTQLYTALLAIVMIMGGTYGVYHSSRIIIKKEFPNRAPASVQEYDNRPDYKMYARKTVKLFNMNLPITVERVGKIRNIVFEFSVRTSTRWARFYLQENETQLKDYFYTTVEPVVSDFPLKEEGKAVLKEKIKFEVNNFLRENGVEGEVEEVRMGFINAY